MRTHTDTRSAGFARCGSATLFRLAGAVLLLLGPLFGLLGAGSLAGPASAQLLWTESDWSQGRYAQATDLDPEIEPGLLVPAARLDDIRFLSEPSGFQGLYCMAVYHDTLFIAASDYPYMFDGAEVLSYDGLTGQFAVDYEPYESGLNIIKQFGDTLYIPGPDSMDPWYTPGSIYTYDGHAWHEHATIDSAVHVADVEVVNGLVFVTTGHMDLTGGVWVSDDYGEHFTRCLTLEPTDEHPIRRFYGAGQFQGRVYVQPDGYPPEGRVLYSSADGVTWQTHSLPALPEDMHATFLVYGDSLLMTANHKFFIYDGSTWSWSYLPFTGWRWCRGYHLRLGELYAGGNSCKVYRWLGDADWEHVADLGLEPQSEEIESIVTYQGRLYVSAVAPAGTLVALPHDFGTSLERGYLTWDGHCPSGGAMIRFQIRSGLGPNDLAAADFVGPDGTPVTFYTVPGRRLPALHDGHRFFQYRVEMLAPDQMTMPLLRSVTLGGEGLAPSSVSEEIAESGETMPGEDRPGPRLRLLEPQPITGRDFARFELTPAGPARLSGATAPEIRIVDAQGRLLRRGRLTPDAAGGAVWLWDLRDDMGRPVGSGFYTARTQPSPGGEPLLQRLLVLR